MAEGNAYLEREFPRLSYITGVVSLSRFLMGPEKAFCHQTKNGAAVTALSGRKMKISPQSWRAWR